MWTRRSPQPPKPRPVTKLPDLSCHIENDATYAPKSGSAPNFNASLLINVLTKLAVPETVLDANTSAGEFNTASLDEEIRLTSSVPSSTSTATVGDLAGRTLCVFLRRVGI